MTEQPFTPPHSSGATDDEHDRDLGQLLEFPGSRRAEDSDTPQPTTPEDAQPAGAGIDSAPADEHGAAVATRPEAGGDVAVPADAPTNRRLAERARAAAARTGQDVRRVGEKSAPVAKGVIRHGGHTVGGTKLAAQRTWSRLTHAELTEAIRAARAAGDNDKVIALEEQKRRAANDRIDRARRELKLIAMVGAICVGAWVITSIATLASAAGIHLFSQDTTFADVWTNGYWAFHVATAEWIGWAASWWPYALGAAAIGALVLTWSTGRANGAGVPGFAQAGMNMPTQAVPIDETTLAQALGALGIKAINDHLKQGLALQYTTMPHRTKNEDGEKDVGISAQVRLPGGTSAEEVIKKTKTLAAALARASVEVWPSTGEDEGLLTMWIADRGSLDGSTPAWPWLERTEAVDLYQGVPIGRTLDGRPIVAPIDGAAYLVGGRPGQGKSQFVRTLVCGALFDPRARIRVHVLASNNDFAPMRKRLERYRTGLGQETIESVLEEMKELYAEVERRGRYMEDHGYDTAAEAGFDPIVSVFDEIHQAFQCRTKELREDICGYAEDLAKLARKYGILVVYATQSADAQSIPKGVTRQCQQRIAYSVTDQPANDGLLGSGSYKQGITATSLRPGNKKYHGDRGKSVTVGLVPEADWAMCCGYYIDSDVLPGLVDRAMQVQSQAGEDTIPAPAPVSQDRDLLADVDAALAGAEKHCVDVKSLLRDLDEHAARYYADLNGAKLREQLKALDVRTINRQQKYYIDPESVRKRLTDRGTAADAEGDSDAASDAEQ